MTANDTSVHTGVMKMEIVVMVAHGKSHNFIKELDDAIIKKKKVLKKTQKCDHDFLVESQSLRLRFTELPSSEFSTGVAPEKQPRCHDAAAQEGTAGVRRSALPPSTKAASQTRTCRRANNRSSLCKVFKTQSHKEERTLRAGG